MTRGVKRVLLVLMTMFVVPHGLIALEPCKTIHGRAHFYGGDGQLRIWHIGTHHEFTPDASTWNTVLGWLEEGVTPSERRTLAAPASAVDLYGDFRVCPTEPFRNGAVQQAKVLSVVHRHYVRID